MVDSGKTPLFTPEERVDMIKRSVGRFPNVTVESSTELVVSLMKARGAKVIVKGLRAVTDYEREFQIALVNRKLARGIETLFMPSDEKYTYISSSVVKEMAKYGAELDTFVPKEIIEDVLLKIRGAGMEDTK
jgi:pantetheine-phosphate adenylyltransferase